ncbi:hypothetical protein NHX12_028832 [Muraenolepis orangiensis]|uniref:Golgin subfamily A member 1 n=1 Tax=Muraenolepis orangiensis TaxID=630683 RepID=A0A9Q0IP71_9TELE|nr:hypothetical protein NHX12_028832 [Muraenolepis orangiensis]
MFAKLKKKIAEEAATAPPRTGGRIPRSASKESITSVGADSGDDFASDGSSSRDDLSSQVLRRNDQVRRLEAKLTDYAEQLRIMQKTKEKVEFALEKHQDSSMRKLQEQNETHQASRAKMAEGLTLALEKKDQEWLEKMEVLEKEKDKLKVRVGEMTEKSLSLFQKRDDRDELETFQQQELAKVKHMKARRSLTEARERLHTLDQVHQEASQLNTELEIEREELLAMLSSVERSLYSLQTEHNALKLQHHKAEVVEEDHASTLSELQLKVVSLERRLQQDLSLDQHLQELLEEKREVEQRLEKTREDLLEARTSHADTVNSLEAQVTTASGTVGELQTLLRHKDDSSKAYRERTDAQIAALEQQVVEASEKIQRAEQEITSQREHLSRLQAAWASEKASLDQQVVLEKQLREDTTGRLEQEKALVESESRTQLDALCLRMARTEELTAARAEMNSRQTVSVEIAMALEDSRRQREELQAQVGDLLRSHAAVQQEVASLTDQLTQREEQITTLQNELQASRVCVAQLQTQLEAQGAQAQLQEAEKDQQLACLREDALGQSQLLDSCQSRISFLEVEVETLTEQLQPPEPCLPSEENGAVTVDDLQLLQKTNRDLEQQLADKTRTIKQLQQRLAELKRTFQKELKLKEINFEYLKHVVLKFMSCRETEAFHLIRAVSVLLNFTREEEDMLKKTLEYKMSWFGSKPSPKGSVRPSISGAPAHWM